MTERALWVYLVHPEIDGETLVPPAAVEAFEALGWQRADVPGGLDLNDPHAPTVLVESRQIPAGHQPPLQRPEPEPEKSKRRSAKTATTQEEAE